MTTDEIIAVLQAYKEGKTIQLLPKDGEDNRAMITDWIDMVGPATWNFNRYHYRVKPELSYQRFESAEEVLEALKEHGGYVKEGNTYRYLKKFTVHENGEITYSFSGWNSTSVRDWESIHDKITFADGTPFGKLIV